MFDFIIRLKKLSQDVIILKVIIISKLNCFCSILGSYFFTHQLHQMKFDKAISAMTSHDFMWWVSLHLKLVFVWYVFSFVLFCFCFKYEWFRFLLLIFVVGGIACAMLTRLGKNCCMSADEVKRKLGARDMVEMQEMLREREYQGRIYYPAGCWFHWKDPNM